MRNGIIPHLSLEDYHKDDALGSSGLRDVLKTPQHYKFRKDHPELYETTQSMNIGTAIHCLILDGQAAFAGKYLVVEVEDKRSAGWKAGKKEAEARKLEAITYSEYVNICFMAENIAKHPIAAGVFKNGKAELSHFAVNENYGHPVRVKARPDYVIHGDLMADYKTTGTDLDVDSFSRTFFSFKNQVQGLFHKDVVVRASGQPINESIYIAQMQKPPFLVRAFALELDGIETAQTEIDRGMTRFAECSKTGIWPGYPDEVASLVKPGYYDLKIEE